MKGPGMRLDLDVRRIWRCPSCDAERRTSGDRTALHCTVCSDRPLMTLIERARPVRPVAQVLDLTIGLHPDDVDAPPQLPPGMTTEPTTESTPESAEGDTRQEAAAESVTPPPRTKQTRPERQKRSGKHQNRRRSRRETAEGAGSSPSVGASSATTASPVTSGSADTPSSSPASLPPAVAPTAPEPEQASPSGSVEPEGFGDGLLDG